MFNWLNITIMNEKQTTSSVSAANAHQLQKRVNELQAAFEIEKNCKNVAYYFILSNGLLWQFKSFCSRYRGNAYQDCREHIRIMASQYMNPCGADAETGAWPAAGYMMQKKGAKVPFFIN